MSRPRACGILEATRAALRRWAALSHGELPGWPTKSITENVFSGRGTGISREMPSEAKMVEEAINRLYQSAPNDRRMILLHYLANGEVKDKMKHLGVGVTKYYFQLEHAEYAVKVEIGY